MKLQELLSDLPTETLLSYTARMPPADVNPAAAWVGKVLLRELASRRDDPAVTVPTLLLAPDQMQAALGWLDAASQELADCAGVLEDRPLHLLASLLHHVRLVIALKASSPVH